MLTCHCFLAVTTWNSTTGVRLNIISLPNKYWPGMYPIVRGYEALIAHAIDDRVFPNGYMKSNTLLSISLVRNLLYITWCTWSTGSLSCGYFTIVYTGLISKAFSKVVKYPLNSYTLSNKTLCGRGYLLIHVLLNNWLTLSDYLSMYS